MRDGAAYRVVKFMVKVKLMENSVKSHVGKVMVVKVMIQYRAPGRTLRMVRITRPRRPNVEGDDVSAGGRADSDVCKASVALDNAVEVGELSATELTELRELTASAAFTCMVEL